MLLLYSGILTGIVDLFFVYAVHEAVHFGMVRPSVNVKWTGVEVVVTVRHGHSISTNTAPYEEVVVGRDIYITNKFLPRCYFVVTHSW